MPLAHFFTYFCVNKFFMKLGQLIADMPKIRHLPGIIVQGRYDVVTPMETAWALKTAWPKANFEIVWDAGHASTEPGIIDGLVRASEAALRL